APRGEPVGRLGVLAVELVAHLGMTVSLFDPVPLAMVLSQQLVFVELGAVVEGMAQFPALPS
ncbi:MAG: hypothetical protein ACKPKO_31835, partial [Candidatus Fonsibacter sp.]